MICFMHPDQSDHLSHSVTYLTALVQMALWRAAKKNGLGRRQIAYQLKQGKCYGLNQSIPREH